ncbi:MAG TPA: hypothetical protein DD384_05240 [Firmicutes bacterium]|nr:hypothetical protein [Bacillota bacterium]
MEFHRGRSMILKEKERYLIVTRKEYFPLLFSFKRAHPNLSLKFIEKSDFFSLLSFSFKEDPIPYLIDEDEGVDYSLAKKFLHIIQIGDLSKNQKARKLYEKIPSDLFSYDPYGLTEIKRNHLLFLEMKEDFELHCFAKRYRISLDDIDISLADLGVSPNERFSSPNILYFPDKFTQYIYLYSHIRDEILSHPEKKDKIQIVYSDEADRFYMNFCSKLFRLPISLLSKRSLLSFPNVNKKAKQIFENRDFAISDEETDDPSLFSLKTLIQKYRLDQFKSFPFAYSNLLEILSDTYLKEEDAESGLLTTTSFYLDPETEYYVTNFKHDVFYHIESDKDALPDQELLKLGVNTSFAKTAIDSRLKLNYLKYNNIVLLSRVRQHLNEKLFDSEFIEELDWGKKIQLYKNDEGGCYTSSAEKIYLANQLDKSFYYKRHGDIRSYDHSFKGVEGDILPKDKPYYLTDLESYIRCPFAYYLKKVLPLKETDPHLRYNGTLIHTLCEHLFHKEYDFEKEWARAKEGYKKSCEKDSYPYGPYEEVCLAILHHRLKRIIPIFRTHNGAMHLHEIPNDSELSISFTLKGKEGTHYAFNGKIDKLVLTEYKGKTYYTIIDYKSGGESFIPENVFLGSSVQLPLYYYALKNVGLERMHSAPFKAFLEGSRFGGFGIQTVYASTAKSFFRDDSSSLLSENGVLANTKLRGLFLDSKDYYVSFDVTSVNLDEDKFNKYGGTYLSKGKLFIGEEEDCHDNFILSKENKKKKDFPLYNLHMLVEDAIQSMIQTIENIKSCKFPISPSPRRNLKGTNPKMSSCQYCLYKDVCYHDANDFKSYVKEIKQHFPTEKKETN